MQNLTYCICEEQQFICCLDRAWFLTVATLGVKVLTKLLSCVEMIEG